MRCLACIDTCPWQAVDDSPIGREHQVVVMTDRVRLRLPRAELVQHISTRRLGQLGTCRSRERPMGMRSELGPGSVPGGSDAGPPGIKFPISHPDDTGMGQQG